MKIKQKKIFPRISSNLKIMVVGASGGIGLTLVKALLEQKATIGAHYDSRKNKLESLTAQYDNLKLFKKHFISEKDCLDIVNEFTNWTKNINALVVCIGGITNPVHWTKLKEEEWKKDLFVNLSVPFFLSRAAMKKMKDGGRIILFSTESALHGGSPNSLAYGVAKIGIECLTKRLAKEGAKNNILVNCIRPAFITSGFHERWQNKDEEALKERINLIPLKRAGTTEEVAALILYLLSPWSDYITGQSIGITGGDWL